MIPYFFVDHILIGRITIQIWGLFVALGIICGTLLATQRALSRGIKRTLIVDLIFWATFVSLAGARIAFIYFNRENGILGFSSAGAILAGAITVLVFSKIKKISIAILLDILGPAVLLAEGIGRIGCFMLHEHLGKITSFMFGVNIHGENRYDLGLYFSLAGFAGLLFVLILEKIWKKNVAGTIGAASLFWYFSWRFSLEFLLESSGSLGVTKVYNLTVMQIFSAIMLVIIALSFFFLPENKGKSG